MTWQFLLWLFFSTQAVAQSDPPGPGNPPNAVKVTLRSENLNLRLAVLPIEPPVEDSIVDPAIKLCEGSCSLTLPPGSYRLEVSSQADSDVLTATTTFSVDRDAEVVIVPASKEGRKRGLALGVGGIVISGITLFVMVVGGFFLSLPCETNCTDQDARARRFWRFEAISSGVLAVGGAMSILGWRSFGRNRRPQLEVALAPRNTVALSNLRVGPIRMGNGWGLGGEMHF